MKSTCWDTHATDSIIKSGQKDTEASIDEGALAGEMKQFVFQIPCEMQPCLNLLRPNYTKERNKRERGHSFVVWRHSATKRIKENDVRAQRGGFLWTPAQLHSAVLKYRAISSPALKLPVIDL